MKDTTAGSRKQKASGDSAWAEGEGEGEGEGGEGLREGTQGSEPAGTRSEQARQEHGTNCSRAWHAPPAGP